LSGCVCVSCVCVCVLCVCLLCVSVCVSCVCLVCVLCVCVGGYWIPVRACYVFLLTVVDVLFFIYGIGLCRVWGMRGWELAYDPLTHTHTQHTRTHPHACTHIHIHTHTHAYSPRSCSSWCRPVPSTRAAAWKGAAARQSGRGGNRTGGLARDSGVWRGREDKATGREQDKGTGSGWSGARHTFGA